MKKALQMTLAGSLFTIEEDAFERLNGYLHSIKAYFKHISDSDDVVEDIEARIAEQLLEKIKHHNNIVTLGDVDHVIKSMGTIEEISGATEGHSEHKHDSHSANSNTTEEKASARKLYRSSDDIVIAGVASGMAAYFGMDPLAMRIIFFVLTIITSGGFIFAYIALALLVQPALTATDKVKMRGGPTTLASFKENFNEQVENMKKNGTDILSKETPARTLLDRIFRFFGDFVRIVVKIIVKAIGLFLIVVPVGIAFALIFMTMNLVFNMQSPYVDFPIVEVISQPLYLLFVLVGFVVAFIPTIFVGALGINIVSGKKGIGGRVALTLGGVWIVALLLAGTLAMRYAPEIRDKVQSLPQYQVSTQTINLADFNKIELYGGSNVSFTQSETFEITVKGRQKDIQASDFTVENGVLIVKEKDLGHICFFCATSVPTEITISAPNISSINVQDGVNLMTQNVMTSDLSLTVGDGAYADVWIDTSNLTVDLSDAGRLLANGTTTNLFLTEEDGARFDGKNLLTSKATVTTTDGSKAHINSTGAIEITAADGSYVTYEGNATTTINLDDSARVIDVSTSTKNTVDLERNRY